MSVRQDTLDQVEEVYQRNQRCIGSFSKKESPELYNMCKHCEIYMGYDHDYSECRDQQCFINWLALEYLDWINGYHWR